MKAILDAALDLTLAALPWLVGLPVLATVLRLAAIGAVVAGVLWLFGAMVYGGSR